ncbi:serine/threonine-protein kinase pakG-like isoform X2 [Macrobrachium nipponense]|uniref:serine/threonine-protein kinase pakG-like isoform X2 n=1 Tax=Macrobrachium nipponense TaxID=159736 RepID=UPI0030C83287
MSTAALDRQHRWRCRLQDLSPHLQPPTPKGQLPKPSSSPFPSRNKQLPNSRFPSHSTPLLNSTPFQFCFPASYSPVFGVSCSVLSNKLLGTNSDSQENARDLPNTFVHRRSFPGSFPATSQVYLVQSPLCSNNNPTDYSKPTTHPVQITEPWSNPGVSHDKLPHDHSILKLDQVGAPVTCTTTTTTMHAQASKESLAVSTLENLNVAQRKCTPGDKLMESGLTCLGHVSGSSSNCNGAKKHKTEIVPLVHTAGTSSTSNACFSTYPSTFVKNVISSSVPKSLVESYACHSGTRLPLFTVSVEPSTEKPLSNKFTIIETKFKKSAPLELNNQYSKSDSNIPSASVSNNNNNNNNNNNPTNPLKEDKGAETAFAASEGVFHREVMRESLTAEEESSSFDSGQDESPDSSKKSPCPRSRKKRPGGYVHQESHLLRQENLDRQSELDLTSQDESLSIEHRRKGMMPCNKIISRVNAGGKYKVTGCCSRRRLIDDEGYIRRAASICVNKEETQVLLVSSKKDRCAWLVPGGGLEVGEDEEAAAVREAWEEAGVLGHIARYLGLFEDAQENGSAWRKPYVSSRSIGLCRVLISRL